MKYFGQYLVRRITGHHDGHGLNEAITIEADGPGPGGASHEYRLVLDDSNFSWIQFQKGPRNVAASIPGITEAALLSVIEDRLESFQAGDYPCEENAEALEHVKAALAAVKKRADARAARGVLGTYQK